RHIADFHMPAEVAHPKTSEALPITPLTRLNCVSMPINSSMLPILQEIVPILTLEVPIHLAKLPISAVILPISTCQPK
ncbi:hypothetical protein, partial [Sporosarcina sp. ZBG7A]|uniref:hypothetical protein n=1 Tax=Sporosarcina sp. ZBG7A TaxID=1582223 RepID=UPI001E2EC879